MQWLYYVQKYDQRSLIVSIDGGGEGGSGGGRRREEDANDFQNRKPESAFKIEWIKATLKYCNILSHNYILIEVTPNMKDYSELRIIKGHCLLVDILDLD